MKFIISNKQHQLQKPCANKFMTSEGTADIRAMADRILNSISALEALVATSDLALASYRERNAIRNNQ